MELFIWFINSVKREQPQWLLKTKTGISFGSDLKKSSPETKDIKTK